MQQWLLERGPASCSLPKDAQDIERSSVLVDTPLHFLHGHARNVQVISKVSRVLGRACGACQAPQAPQAPKPKKARGLDKLGGGGAKKPEAGFSSPGQACQAHSSL